MIAMIDTHDQPYWLARACKTSSSYVGRSEQERLKHKTRQAEDHVTGLRRQLDDRSREVEQLTTLSLKGDATLQEYMAQLTVSSTSFTVVCVCRGFCKSC